MNWILYKSQLFEKNIYYIFVLNPVYLSITNLIDLLLIFSDENYSISLDAV